MRAPVQRDDAIGMRGQLFADHHECVVILNELKPARHIHGAGRARQKAVRIVVDVLLGIL